jgi:hypothetical protein
MKNLWNREPALWLGLITAAVNLATAFGLNLDAAQQGAIGAFSVAIMALVTRSVVTSPASAAVLLDDNAALEASLGQALDQLQLPMPEE